MAALRGKNISSDKLKKKVSSMVNKRVSDSYTNHQDEGKRRASAPCKTGNLSWIDSFFSASPLKQRLLESFKEGLHLIRAR